MNYLACGRSRVATSAPMRTLQPQADQCSRLGDQDYWKAVAFKPWLPSARNSYVVQLWLLHFASNLQTETFCDWLNGVRA